MRDAHVLELISAYVDGVITAEERALVERHLADSADYRRYLTQLQQQRALLQGLPIRKPPVELAGRVLQAIDGMRTPLAAPQVVSSDRKAVLTGDAIQELLSGYVDDALSTSEAAWVEQHLAESAESRRYLNQLRAQRSLLKELPRRTLPASFAARVQSAVAASSSSVAAGEANRPTPVRHAGRRKLWMGVAGSIVAATLTLFILRPSGFSPSTAPANGPSVAIQPRESAPAVPEPDGAPAAAPTDSFLETAVAVGEFRQLVKQVFVYEVYVTDKGRDAKCVERWLKAAKIPLADTVKIDPATEQAILKEPFNRNQVPLQLPGKVDHEHVEMMLIRGTAGHIDDVFQAYKRDQSLEKGEAQVIVDVLFAPRELEILLKLNEATGLDLADMKADPGILSIPAAFRVTLASVARDGFGGFGMTSVLMGGGGMTTIQQPAEQPREQPQEQPAPAPTKLETRTAPAVTPAPAGKIAPAAAPAPDADDPFQRNLPAQTLVIIRSLQD